MSGNLSNADNDVNAFKKLFKIALDSRNFEINQLSQRNNFFMVFQGVSFAGLLQSDHNIPVVSFMVCIAGFFVSVYQTRVASGAKFWQEYWESSLSEIEKRMLREISQADDDRRLLLSLFHDDHDLYGKIVREKLRCKGNSIAGRLIMGRYSVSKTPIYVGLVLSIVWFLLILCTMRGYPPLSIPDFIHGFPR